MPPATDPRSDQFVFSLNHGSCIRPANSVLTPVNHVIGSLSITVFRFDSGRGLGTSTFRPPAR